MINCRMDRYTKEELENFIKLSTSLIEFALKMGYTSCSGDTAKAIKKRILQHSLSIEHWARQPTVKRNEENIFIEHSTANQATLRRHYLKGNYTSYECSICHQEPIWQEKELSLTLDHINGENKDDRLENLRWVCPNCDRQLNTFGSKNKKIFNKTEVQKNYCIDCGQEIWRTATRCVKCNSLFSIKVHITREELKDKIRILPFTEIGKEYNVSDNAIRKWCDTYKLPRRKSDIKEITDEDWLNV